MMTFIPYDNMLRMFVSLQMGSLSENRGKVEETDKDGYDIL
jgi:hypothetical protein